MIYPLGLDIGGSIVKLVYYGPNHCGNLPDYVILDDHLDGEYFAPINNIPENFVHFIKIPIAKFLDFLNFIQSLDCIDKCVDESISKSSIGITGGGSFKYQDLLQSLPLKFNKQDEISCLIKGLNYALLNYGNEVFTYGWRDKVATFCNMDDKQIYPYLLVNIGSGVSIIKVNENSYERITGTSLGGGTFWGLTKLITGVTNFNTIEHLSDSGDNKNVDLLIEDIYGGDYDEIGLAGYIIASNFGKVATNGLTNKPKNDDIIKSLLYMIADNICQIAYLSIKNDSSIKNIYFTGSFTNIGPVLWKKLSYGIEFWSNEKIQAKFLRHEGYFGAIGSSLS